MSSSFRHIFIRCRIEPLQVLWFQELPLLLSVFLEINVRVEEALICSFCSYCFFGSQRLFTSLRCLSNVLSYSVCSFSASWFGLISWSQSLLIVYRGSFKPSLVFRSGQPNWIEDSLLFMLTKCCGCSRISAEPIYHSLVSEFYDGPVLHGVRLTNNLVETNSRLDVQRTVTLILLIELKKILSDNRYSMQCWSL